MRPDVRFGTGEIEGGVRDVQIPATHHGFVLFEVLEVGEQATIPIQPFRFTIALLCRVLHLNWAIPLPPLNVNHPFFQAATVRVRSR